MPSPLDRFSLFPKPWYSEGLNFACTECGKCCTGSPGYVWVSDSEIASMADHLKISIQEFKNLYLRFVDGRYSLKESSANYDCVFLKEKKCQIYPARPKQCRTFPWWPHFLQSKENWEKGALQCEGINPNAPLVPFEHINEQVEQQKQSLKQHGFES